MECAKRGRQIAKFNRCCGLGVGRQFLCSEFGACTDIDAGFKILATGEPMAVCAGCPAFAAAVSETEAAFNSLPWGSGESVSGPGSSLDATATIRERLPRMLEQIGASSILDIPCGDCNWMSQAWSGLNYIGADVVRDIVDRNRQRFHGVRFEHLDIVASDLPKADVVFTRDCFVHLPYRMIGDSLKNIVRSAARWLITTHFPGRKNHDIPLASWRPLDMTAAPFNLPYPRYQIIEQCTEGEGSYADKSLGVWLIDDIREAVSKLNAVPRLTIGMPCYRDWPGVWATLEALDEMHGDILPDCELIIVDNDPAGTPDTHNEREHSNKCKRHVEALGGRYEHFTAVQGTAATKNRIFELATSPNVLVIDCHVLLKLGSVRKLIEYFEENPETLDLLQGPCKNAGDYFEPKWGGMMFGRWANDARAKGNEPFEIPMQGCGLIACRKAAWPGFHPLLRGFGPEEWHIHQRIRRNGGKCLCMPWLRWSHRFGNPSGPVNPGDSPAERLRGHLITWLDTGGELDDFRQHFVIDLKKLTSQKFDSLVAETRKEFGDKQVRGLGDRIGNALAAIGIPKCGGCGQRAETINRVVTRRRAK